jgi:hypothetical protein
LVNEALTLEVNSELHYRTATLLGRLAEVRFTPQRVSWLFGDGAVADGANTNHSFSRVGSYVVSARVFYDADYRLSGSLTWISGGVISLTNQVVIEVGNSEGQAPPSAPSKRVLLVAKNCVARPAAFGCAP